MKKFIGEQISRFFNTGQWALKLVFLVVLTELAIIGGVTLGCMTGTECDENDSNNIKHLLSLAMTKSFALYAAEKASSKEKYLIEGVSKK
jgi:hypothetical protein|tara:strand:- start:200 stop:469 length:270 start_codon:yes stop_codon:yes gene_type:complete